MKIETIVVGPLGVNCYIVVDPASRAGMVIDPGDDAAEIIRYIGQANIQVKYIVNTHGHSDHIGANAALKAATKAPLLIHAADELMLKNPLNYLGETIVSSTADAFLKDGDILSLGGSQFKVLHTPGHTAGGICLQGDNVLFSGDSLFAESIGRCDLPGGNLNDLIGSLKTKVMALPDDVMVYPGHGPATKIGWERRHNPYLAADFRA